MIRQIVAKIDPLAIYLFGSRARGDADADSDYDLMIVVPDEISEEPAVLESGTSIGRIVHAGLASFRLDSHYIRRSTFASRCLLIGTLEAEGNDGIILYKDRSVQLCPSKPRKEDILKEAARLADNARFCLVGYSRLDGVPVDPRHTLCEAAQLLVQAALVSHQARPSTTETMGELARVLPASFALRSALMSLHWPRVTRSRKAERTGRAPASFGDDELEASLKHVAALITRFERWLAGRAGGTGGDG